MKKHFHNIAGITNLTRADVSLINPSRVARGTRVCVQFCRRPLLLCPFVREKQFRLYEFSRGRRTVKKRNEMHLCATVSLSFCMLPKVVISHGRKDRSSAPMSERSLMAENKMSERDERSGTVLRPRGRFWSIRETADNTRACV